jgi:hypothetical protein
MMPSWKLKVLLVEGFLVEGVFVIGKIKINNDYIFESKKAFKFALERAPTLVA